MSESSAGGGNIKPASEDASALIDLLTEIDVLHGVHERQTRARASASSILAADDLASRPIQMSHLVEYCLLQSGDALRTVQRVLREDEGKIVIPIMGIYPIVRSAIESACLARWLIGPSTRQERIVRLLKARHHELIYEKGLHDELFGAADRLPPVMRRAANEGLRNVVERCFNKLKQWRGIAMRSDKTARNYHAALCLAATLQWVCKTP